MRDSTRSNFSQSVEAMAAAFATIPTINGHTHVISESDRLRRDLDALSYFAHPYPSSDLRSAGMSDADLQFVTGDQGHLTVPDCPEVPAPLEERWERFRPWWERVRFTGFSQCLLEGWRAAYGIDRLDATTVGQISDAIRDGREPGHYAKILRDKANIRISLVQMTGTYGEEVVDVDRELFLPVPRLNRFTMLRNRRDLMALEADYSTSFRTVEDVIATMHARCAAWKAAGAPEVKLSQSYHRALDFGEGDNRRAEAIFRQLRDGHYSGLDTPDGRTLEDVLVHGAVSAATAAGLPVQFHVGPRAGTYGSLEGTSLAPMAGLIRAHRDARFDISHSGFPYLTEAAVLAKTCENVFLNLSWMHIYSPEGCVRALREWIRMVPVNKIIGFGDDLYWVDTILGHLVMARQNVARAVVGMIEDGLLTETAAVDIGKALFRDNPSALYAIA
jgi:hypothetical protein